MSRLPDLVRDSKLDSQFLDGNTIHLYYESGPSQRVVLRKEYWKRDHQIGQGAYGNVWLEKCVEGHRKGKQRAVKQIPTAQKRLKTGDYFRELEAIAKFSHAKYERCFVKSFGWYEGPGTLFIAMEYFQHGDLQSYLSRSSPLPEYEAREITFQVLEGLSFMHEEGFAHRDLKPANILIKSQPPETWWVKVGDFGISKRTEEGVGASLTLQGTLGFMPPELFGFVKTPNCINAQAADMWSLGEIAFQMLTKQPTFGSIALLLRYVANPQTFPLSTLYAQSVSDLATNFIKFAMVPMPQDRLTAKQALDHIWMKPYRSTIMSQSIMSESSQLLEETSALSISEPLSPRTMIGSTVSVPGMEYRSLQTSTIPYHGDRGYQDTQDTRRREYTGSPSLEEPSSECSSSPPELDHAQRKPSSQLRKSTNEMALPFQLNGHSRAACAVAFSPDGKFIASGSDDKTVRIWVIATGETLRELTGHSDAVWAVAFSMDGRLIASGSRDNTVWIWDTTTGKGLRKLMGHSAWVNTVAFSPDNILIASGSRDTTIRLWDAATGLLLQELTGHSAWVHAVAFSPDGKLIASGSLDKTVRIWDITTLETSRRLMGHSARVWAVAFSPDGQLIASGSRDKTVRLWDAATGKPLRELTSHSDWVRAVAFSPDGRLLVSGSEDKTVRIWDAATGKALRELTGHSDSVGAVAFSPDGWLIASGSRDTTVRLWDTAVGNT